MIANDHGRRDILPQRRMVDAKRRGVQNVGMAQQRGVDFRRGQLETAAIDDFLDASGDEQVAVLIEMPEVAGAKPAVAKCVAISAGVVLVAARDTRAPDDDLAGHVRAQAFTALAGNGDIRSD
jgi:hypothetical protein